MRKTNSLVRVAAALMSDPSAKHWGYQLSKESGIRSGVMYPILSRLEAEGWITDGWEDPATITEKRPPRRYYELTEIGLRELGAVLAQARTEAQYRNQYSIGWKQAWA